MNETPTKSSTGSENVKTVTFGITPSLSKSSSEDISSKNSTLVRQDSTLHDLDMIKEDEEAFEMKTTKTVKQGGEKEEHVDAQI